MSVVRRNDGGGAAPRPRMEIVQVRDRAEKRATTRLRQKSSLEVSPGILTIACGFILQDKWHERKEERNEASLYEERIHAIGEPARSTIRR
jgi:hypothetical protein